MSDSRGSWEEKAQMANTRGWRLLVAAKKCFELAEIAKYNATLHPVAKSKPQGESK